MHRFLEELKDFSKKADWVLLTLCLVTSGFGLIVMASATSAEKFGSNTKIYHHSAAGNRLGRSDVCHRVLYRCGYHLGEQNASDGL